SGRTGTRGRRGGGRGSKTTGKFRVIGKFLTNKGADPFTAGDITMIIYDIVNGVPGKVLWRPGFVAGKGTTYPPAYKSNSIQSDPVSVTGKQVLVELRVRMYQADHDLDPNLRVIYFGTAEVFETPDTGTLRVDVDVVTEEREFTEDAADKDAAEIQA